MSVPELLALAMLVGGSPSVEKTNQTDDHSTLFVEAPFPDGMKLHNLQEYQRFEVAVLVNTTARVVRKPEGKGTGVLPDIAESWRVSHDGLHYIFHLRSDARFSDGSPITARDVVWSIQRMFVNKGIFTGTVLKSIKGWEGLTNADASIDGLRASDDHTFEIVLTQAQPDLLDQFLGLLPTSVFKRNSVPAGEDRLPSTFPCSGPYVVEQFAPEQIVLALNPLHWRAKEPGIPKRVVIRRRTDSRAIERIWAGRLDYALYVPESTIDLERAKASGLQEVARDPSHFFMVADLHGPAFSVCPGTGRIINALIDRKALVGSLGRPFLRSIKPIYGYAGGIVSLRKEFGENPSPQEVAAAKAELSQHCSALLRPTPGVRIVFIEGNVEDEVVARELRRQLAAFGIAVNIVPVPFYDVANPELSKNPPFDFAMKRVTATPQVPAAELPYVVGLDPARTHLPPTHPVFQIQDRIRRSSTQESNINVLRDFHKWALDDGFAISLAEDDMVTVASGRFDATRVPKNSYMFDGTYFRLRE